MNRSIARDVDWYTGEWDYRQLPANVRLGKDVFLERGDAFHRFRSRRDPGLVLGDRVKAFTWTGFSIEPDGLVEVGSDTTLVGAQFMCQDHIRVGARVFISYLVAVADSDFHPLDPELRKADAVASAPERSGERPPFESQPVVIEDDVWIGIGAMILKGVHIGRGARVGAGAVVVSDVPAGTRVEGNPARVVEG